MAVSGDVLNSRKQIANSTMPNLELHYTEWSSSYTPADPRHDRYHEAAYILQKIKQVGNSANSMSYWVFTDIFEEAGPRFTPFHGGFGLLNTQGINKSAYYSYKFMNEMGETELQNTDDKSWVCKDANGNVQVLLWDYTHTLPADSVNNQAYYIRDLPATSKGKVRIGLSGMAQGKYKLEIYRIGYKSNDAYSTYLAMGRPDQLTKTQVELIKKQNNGSPLAIENIQIKKNQSFVKELDLCENDVYFLKILKQ